MLKIKMEVFVTAAPLGFTQILEPPVDNCAICYNPLNNGQIVFVHENEEGAKHPLHRRCWQKIYRKSHNLICPLCRKEVNLISIIPWNKRKNIQGLISLSALVTLITYGKLFFFALYEKTIEARRIEPEPYVLPIFGAIAIIFSSSILAKEAKKWLGEIGKDRMELVVDIITAIAGLVGIGSVVARNIGL